jgi:hypothetical protein
VAATNPSTERIPSPARRATRVIQIVYVAFAAAFIVYSTWQVEQQVFGVGASVPASGSCSMTLKAFEEAVDRGLAHAAVEHTKGKADEAFEDAVSTPLEAVKHHCKDGADREAYTAAVRYRDAAEDQIEQQHTNLANLREALDARLTP